MTLTVLVYALLAGFIPCLLWLYFWLKEDNLHPEPRSVITLAFIAGCATVILAVILEKIAQDYLVDNTTRYAVWATIEEVVKLLAVLLVAFHSNLIDEPIDAMIYCITVALGFAALENALFVLNPLHLGQFSESIITGNLRFIGATLVHVVCSAAIGFMYGLAFYQRKLVKMYALLFGVILASALHTAFNLAIIYETATSTLKVFGWVWCAVVILIILFEEVKAVKANY